MDQRRADAGRPCGWESGCLCATLGALSHAGKKGALDMTNQEVAARWEELRTVWGKFPDSIDIISVCLSDTCTGCIRAELNLHAGIVEAAAALGVQNLDIQIFKDGGTKQYFTYDGVSIVQYG